MATDHIVSAQPTAGPTSLGLRPQGRDRAALALDGVVAVSVLVAAIRVIELAVIPGLWWRTVGYGAGLTVAVLLWLVWRRESRRAPTTGTALGGPAVAFTVITGSLFFIGDQPLPLPLFVVGLIMLLRSYGVRAGVIAVTAMLGLQAVLFLTTRRGLLETLFEVLASAFVFGFGLLIAWLFAEIDRQRRNNAALATEVLRRSGIEAELASLRERQRSARDLHDGIGHQATVILMSLRFAERMRCRDPDRAWAEVIRAREQAAAALGEIRRLARALHPGEMRGGGQADLSALATSFEGTGLAVTVSDDADGVVLPDDLALFRHRFLQETLTNVVRHAAASRVTIAQRVGEGQLVLSVVDNGGPVGEIRAGFGLRSLSERAEELGGRTAVQSGPSGLEVTAVVPVAAGERP
ncbi:MAG: histidine kinase [Microlunatus sp.]|nr:histidine kinase [Microlunatus sp.]MDN5804903.1 histidine kinase [Microlunatus sp.]